ncbi:hypothetical protein [Pseudoalteromonas viridis]|uniref:Uncharacterized protein n=1 Tax=Pseudoalteromonas viridis TaxID=339617 RepID=A0ABX7V0C3_9GAMM|nr:hypothetical protein [Pseudoalteromonas viridis]QTL34319.1 hypothetical protein J5X90_12185 [Pseudoalteromonas viridis]
MFKRISKSECIITFVAMFFIYLAIKESNLPLANLLTNSSVSWLFLESDTSGLLFNVSCGAIATYIFWFIDIFIPRHQQINVSRKYLPQWSNYLKQHCQRLDSILEKLGETKNGEMTRITLGSTQGINDSLDVGIEFPKIPVSEALGSLNAINTVITDIRKYEHSLNKIELRTVHELHMELIMYLSFVSLKDEIGTNKDFNDIKLIRNKVKETLKLDIFKSVA